jgi:acetyl-CoA carboxylase carboxyltransferase component
MHQGAMPVFRSRFNPESADTKANLEAMQALMAELDRHKADALNQGSEKYLNRLRAEGRLLPRERISLLLDPGSPFMELCPFAGLGGDGFGTGGTIVVGLGYVSRRLVMVNSNVGSIKGGAIDHATLEKARRCNQIARENGLICVNMVESAGANLPDQARIFNYGGESFREITRRSKLGFPTISLVFGSSTAGGAYIPGMSDYVVMVKEQAKVFLAGPPLVKMATGEETDDETLGGAEMHSRISGASDFMAENEREAILLAREIVSYLPRTARNHDPKFFWDDSSSSDGPAHDAEEILAIVQADLKKAFDQRELIARFVDRSDFLEFKPHYGQTLITAFARVDGYRVGIIANNGVLFSEAANKGAQFIQLCNQSNIPLIFLQNITGFMVGTKYEQEGIIKHGAKMINAVSNSTVPAITIITGASYGAGNYAMCGRAFEPRFLFSYPNSRIAVMGPEQLAGVMQIIGRQAAEKAGVEYDEDQGRQMAEYMVVEAGKQSTAWYATGQVWDDGVIDPRQTRQYLTMALWAVHNLPFEGTKGYGVFRM